MDPSAFEREWLTYKTLRTAIGGSLDLIERLAAAAGHSVERSEDVQNALSSLEEDDNLNVERELRRHIERARMLAADLLKTVETFRTARGTDAADATRLTNARTALCVALGKQSSKNPAEHVAWLFNEEDRIRH